MITRNLGETDAHYALRAHNTALRTARRRARQHLTSDSLAGARSALAVLTAAAGQPADRAKAVATR